MDIFSYKINLNICTYDYIQMFKKIITLSFLLFNIVESFQNAKLSSNIQKPKTNTFEFYGDIEPLGFFDPLQITANSDEKTLKYMREAEIHHGRIAMISSIILPVLDKLHPEQLAINVLYNSGESFNNIALTSMGFFEIARMTTLYKSPRIRPFEIKDESQPGQLNPYYKLNTLQANKELSNGRLAMISVFVYMSQEFITQHKCLF